MGTLLITIVSCIVSLLVHAQRGVRRLFQVMCFYLQWDYFIAGPGILGAVNLLNFNVVNGILTLL